MKLEPALFAYLSTSEYLVPLVGTRIFPTRLPEGVDLPAITWTRVSANREYTHDQYIDDPQPWVRARVQFNCWATTARGAIEVGEGLLFALSGYDGDMAGELVGSSEAVNELDTYEQDTKIFRRLLDFVISYEEDAIPAS